MCLFSGQKRVRAHRGDFSVMVTIDQAGNITNADLPLRTGYYTLEEDNRTFEVGRHGQVGQARARGGLPVKG